MNKRPSISVYCAGPNRQSHQFNVHIVPVKMSHKSAAYLLQLMRNSMTSVDDHQFEDILQHLSMEESDKPIGEKLTMMLREPPIMSEEYASETSEAQADVTSQIEDIYKHGSSRLTTHFLLEKHLDFVDRSLYTPLPAPYVVLDANHGWMLYWLINSYAAMNHKIDDTTRKLVREKIRRNIVSEGAQGIGSGVGQIGHCASTYASVLALVLIEDWETLLDIRSNLYRWFMSLKQPNGSFIMHKNGESDTRSTYCVLVVSSLLGISTPELLHNTLKWVSTCQTYEGGFSGTPGTEAHGGYLYCALASYFLALKETPTDQLNVHAFLRWSVMRQHQLEGGLSGRTGKLVDGCYSYWVGATFPLLEMMLETGSLFDREALQIYILKCCQSELGGFKDKPEKMVDFYHTNYVLCGLSITQHQYYLEKGDAPVAYRIAAKSTDAYTLPIHPVFGIPVEAVKMCHEKMKKL